MSRGCSRWPHGPTCAAPSCPPRWRSAAPTSGSPRWTGVTPGDGPQDVHLILLENGRTAAFADPVGRSALHCIRCSACLNVCPVYERAGGHAYGSVYPGPIGAVLTPQLAGMKGHVGHGKDHGKDPVDTLPFASSLCGACYEVCPVKIDIPSLLVHLRSEHVEGERARHRIPSAEAAAMAAAAWTMASPGRFAAAERALGLGRLISRRGKISTLPPPLSLWTSARDLPAPPAETFRQWWQRNRGGNR
jgi:L-lactate dehydrogenase complex protein LldF